MTVTYTVRAVLPSRGMQREYIEWLLDGHVLEVCRLGPASATIVALDPPPDTPAMTVEVRYLFADRASLDRYLADHSPRLRAVGQARFGPSTGVGFSRTIGEVVATSP